MQVGELITRFEDEAVAVETLVALDDIALTARVSQAAAEQELTIGEFAVVAVQRFASHATHEDWLTLLGRMSRTEDPGRIFLRYVLSSALTDSDETHRMPSPPLATM